MMRAIFAVILFACMPFVAAAQDWSKPDLGSSKANFMTEMHDIINQCAKQDITGSNIPIGSLRYNRTNDYWEEWNGTAWALAPISASALGGITGSIITDGSIGTADLANDSVTEPKIAAGAVGSSEIADGSVTSTDIANGTITGTDIQDGTIGSADITDDSITSSDIGTDAVGFTEIIDGSVRTQEILDNTITADDIATDGVGAAEIAAGAVGNGELADNAVTGGKIQDGTIGSSDIQDASITGTDIAVGTIVESNIWDGNITNAKIADGAVTHAKLSGTWQTVTVGSGTLFDCGASCGNGTGETGTYKYIQFGPIKYFYLDLTYTFAGTSVDELGLELPIAAANANFTFFCTVGANNGEAVVGISNSGSTTQARLVKTSGNFGEGSGRNLKCSGFYE